MPVAHSFSDGTLSFSSSKIGPNLRNTITFQALPRISGSFRYSGIGDKEKMYYQSGYTTWDRSFDLRLNILKEESEKLYGIDRLNCPRDQDGIEFV